VAPYKQKKKPAADDGFVDVTNGVPDDGFVDVTPKAAAPVQTQVTQPPPDPSLWDKANTGLISPDTIARTAMTGVSRDGAGMGMDELKSMRDEMNVGDNSAIMPTTLPTDINERKKLLAGKSAQFKARESQGETPTQAALRRGGAGTVMSAADTLSSFTSPVSIGMAGMGALGKAGNVAPRIARAAKVGSRAAGIGFGAQGANNAYDAAPGMMKGDPDSIQKFLTGASMATGGAGDLLPERVANMSVGDAARTGLGVRGSLSSRTAPDTGGLSTGDVYNEMRKRGVDMTIGQAGQGKTGRFIDEAVSRTPGGAGRMAKFRQKQGEQYAGAVKGIEDQFDPTGAGTDVAEKGGQLQRALSTAKDVAHDNASQAFKDTLGDMQYTTADTADIADAARAAKNQLMQGQLDTMKPHPAVSVLDEIINRYGDQHNNKSMVDDLFRDRSRLMKSQFTDSLTPGESEGVMRQMAGVMRTSLESAANKAGRGQQFGDAMKGWGDYIDTFGDRSSPINRALDQNDPSKILEPFIGSRGTGSLNAVRMLKRVAPDFVGMLKREVVRKLYDPNATGARENYGNMQANLLRYNEPFLKELFTPEELKSLRAFAAGGRSIGLDVNPSGSGTYGGQLASTATVLGGVGTGLVGVAQHNPVMAGLGAVGAAGLPVAANVGARVQTSQPIVDFLMGNGGSPSAPAASGAALSTRPAGGTAVANPFGKAAQAIAKFHNNQAGTLTLGPDGEPVWPENYRNVDQTKPGGANYSPEELEAFKKKNNIEDKTIKDRVGDFHKDESGTMTIGKRTPKGSTVPLFDKPLGDKATLLDLGQALHDHSVSQGMKPLKVFEGEGKSHAAMLARAQTLAEHEAQHQLAQNSTMTEWYRKDIDDMVSNMSEKHSELADNPKKAIFYKAIVAASSLGNNSPLTMKLSDQVYSKFKETGSIPMDQGRTHEDPEHPNFGKPVKWPGQGGTPVFGTIQKLLDLHGGDTDKVADFLTSEHTIGELRQIKGTNSGLPGKASDKAMGAMILGEKAGPFFQNMNGVPTELTADRWFNRTWNRWMGTLLDKAPGATSVLAEVPRNNTERQLQRQAISETARKLGINTDQLQAVLWAHEQKLYQAHGVGKEQLTYGSSSKQHIEKLREAGELQSSANAEAGRPAGSVGQNADSGKAAAGDGAVAEEVRTENTGSSKAAESQVPGETQRDRRKPSRKK
jgi:hypothetical protein